MGLLAVGELPKVTRTGTGRRPGKWRGHEEDAQELRQLQAGEQDPERCWGLLVRRVNENKAQSIVSAVKKGEAIGFEHTPEGCFEAVSRKSPDQGRAPVNPRTKEPFVLYDVWARYVPATET